MTFRKANSMPTNDTPRPGGLLGRMNAATLDYVTQMLTGFSAKLQNDLEVRLDQADECNAAILLSELCEFWGLSDTQRIQVLGSEAMRYVQLLEADHLSMEEGIWSLGNIDQETTYLTTGVHS